MCHQTSLTWCQLQNASRAASKAEEFKTPQIARALRVNLLVNPIRKKRMKLMQSGKLHKLHIRHHSLHMVNILQIEDLLSINNIPHNNNHTYDNILHISSVSMSNKDQGSQRDTSIRFQSHTIKYCHI